MLNTTLKATLLGKSPMEIELGFQPRTPLDMVSEISRHKFDSKISVVDPAKPVSAAETLLFQLLAAILPP